MYHNILVPVAPDAHASAAQAVQTAKRLGASDARITALSVFEPVPEYIRHQVDEDRETTLHDASVAQLRADLDDGVAVKAVPGQPGRAILKWAKANDVDCIVMASNRPEVADFFLGSTAARVVRHAGCAVHVLR